MDEFTALIEYIQTGTCVIHAHILSGLACAAENYEVDDLEEQCVECCYDLLNPYTVCLLNSTL